MAKRYLVTGMLFVAGILFGVLGMALIGAGKVQGEPVTPGPGARPPSPIFSDTMPGRLPAGGIAVSGGFVYVILGNTVYKLDASNLEVVSQVRLGEPRGPLPMPPAGQPRQ